MTLLAALLAGALSVASTLPQGVWSAQLDAGVPLSGVQLARGMASWLTADLRVDGDPRRFLRLGGGARARILGGDCAGLTSGAQLAYVQPLSAGYGPRLLYGALDAEVSAQAHFAIDGGCTLVPYASAGGLLDTALARTRTSGLIRAAAGVEWSLAQRCSLFGEGGELAGYHGHRAIFSGGLALRF